MKERIKELEEKVTQIIGILEIVRDNQQMFFDILKSSNKEDEE